MKKFSLISLILLLSVSSSLADDLWDNFGDSNVYGQQSVTDDDFDKALESKQKKQTKKDKNIPKGESFSQSNETEMLSNTTKELPVLMIPVSLKIKEGYIIPPGHYQVEGEKDGSNNVYINLYQAHNVIAKIPAEETNDDFGEDIINFVKLEPHGDYHVELRYGGVDFNAYSIIDTE